MKRIWFTVFRGDGASRAAIIVDVGYRDAGLTPDAERPLLSVVRVQLEHPGEEGLGDHDEVAAADGKFDEIRGELGSVSAEFVARARTRGRLDFLLYSPVASQADIERAARTAFGERVIAVEHQDDASWSVYQTLLPSPFEERLTLDSMVVRPLAAAGDPLTPKRDVRHYAYFRDEASANAFADAVRSRGFQDEVTNSPRPEPGETMCVIAARDDSVEIPGISEITSELSELAASHGGKYDGWEAALVQAKKPGMLSRLFKR